MARRMACPEIEKIFSVTHIFDKIFLVEYLFKQKSWQKRKCLRIVCRSQKCKKTKIVKKVKGGGALGAGGFSLLLTLPPYYYYYLRGPPLAFPPYINPSGISQARVRLA